MGVSYVSVCMYVSMSVCVCVSVYVHGSEKTISDLPKSENSELLDDEN